MTDPLQLPDRLRTERWRALCEACEHWGHLPAERRCRLIALLHALCLYECVLELVPATSAKALRDPHEAELSFWRSFAQYMMSLPARISDYHSADMSVFEGIALDRAQTSPARFNSATRVFIHKVKTGDPDDDLPAWGTHLERALSDTVSSVDDFTAELLKSRFYRAMGFIPQRQGSRAETMRIMDLAEHHAFAMRPQTSAENILCHENLHALMESRTKEAIWLGDHDLALSRSLKVIDADPYDSKAWTEVGEVRMLRREWDKAAEAYAVAAVLGPPASALARHMAGLCLQRLGHHMVAALLFKDALELDPYGISPQEALGEMQNKALSDAVNRWIESTFEP